MAGAGPHGGGREGRAGRAAQASAQPADGVRGCGTEVRHAGDGCVGVMQAALPAWCGDSAAQRRRRRRRRCGRMTPSGTCRGRLWPRRAAPARGDSSATWEAQRTSTLAAGPSHLAKAASSMTRTLAGSACAATEREASVKTQRGHAAVAGGERILRLVRGSSISSAGCAPCPASKVGTHVRRWAAPWGSWRPSCLVLLDLLQLLRSPSHSESQPLRRDGHLRRPVGRAWPPRSTSARCSGCAPAT
jgi:hypothetical protein